MRAFKLTLPILFLFFIFSTYSQSQTDLLSEVKLDTQIIASGLHIPWDIEYIGNEQLIYTEKKGNIGWVNLQTGERRMLHQIEDVAEELQGGLMGLAVHPDFSSNPLIYTAYTYYQNRSLFIKVAAWRVTDDRKKVVFEKNIIENIPTASINVGGRMAISKDGYLYLSIGEGEISEWAQEEEVLYGKILRYHLDGRIPADNPITGSPIWAKGFRNSQGLAIGKNGLLYATEHGTIGNDELDLVVKSGNYGWPLAGGVTHDKKLLRKKKLKNPMVEWSPSAAPAGLDYYDGDAIAGWKNTLLVTCLKTQGLKAVQLSPDGKQVTREHFFLKNVAGRLRDVEVTPDGRVFVCTSNSDLYGGAAPNSDKIIEITAGEGLISPEYIKNDFEQYLHLDSTNIDIRTVAENLRLPWSLEWGNDGHIWFNERDGKIKKLNPETGEITLIHEVKGVFESEDNSGMHGFALHPHFPLEPYFYGHYTTSLKVSRLVRFTYNVEKQKVTKRKVILSKIKGHESHNGSRILFADDGTFYFSTGDAFKKRAPQDLESLNGKILRFNADGSIPADNPVAGSPVWSYGHRNPQGLAWGRNGILYSSEHGAVNDDELNIILKNKNYGWPKVQGYCDLPSEKRYCEKAAVEECIYSWTPTIGVCGIDYYDHPAIPEWQNTILACALKGGDGRVGQRLYVAHLSEDGQQVEKMEEFFTMTFGRLRDVLVAPDGRIFLCTSNKETNRSAVEIAGYSDDRIIELKSTRKVTLPAKNRSNNKGYYRSGK